MALRGKPTLPGLNQSGPRITSNVYVAEVAKVVKQVVASDAAALASLQAQLAQAQQDLTIAEAQVAADCICIESLQSQVTSLQSQVASLQAQATTDAATIASLQRQVTTMTAQVASLTSQVTTLSNRFPVLFYTNITTIDDNFYVPPSFDDQTVDIGSSWKLPPVKAYNNITTVGGGWP
jgi:hypothetical protein